MNYVSTRDGSIKITSATAIVRGLSADGGLFMPESIPSVSDSELRTLSEMDYRQRAKLVLSKFLTDYTAEEIENCVNGAYTGSFDNEQPAPNSAAKTPFPLRNLMIITLFLNSGTVLPAHSKIWRFKYFRDF